MRSQLISATLGCSPIKEIRSGISIFGNSQRAMHREVEQADGTYALRESSEAYRANFTRENKALRSENTIPQQKSAEFLRDSVVPVTRQRPTCAKPEPPWTGSLP